MSGATIAKQFGRQYWMHSITVSMMVLGALIVIASLLAMMMMMMFDLNLNIRTGDRSGKPAAVGLLLLLLLLSCNWACGVLLLLLTRNSYGLIIGGALFVHLIGELFGYGRDFASVGAAVVVECVAVEAGLLTTQRARLAACADGSIRGRRSFGRHSTYGRRCGG